MQQPAQKPNSPFFSSGPCAKRPGWSLDALNNAALGRSHRSKIGKAKLKEAIDKSKSILGIPDDYVLGIVPASDTGAIEMAMWNLLGERGVDVLAWESFGSGWVKDCKEQLKLDDLRVLKADYGQLPDLSEVNCHRDVVFTYNGTTSGVCVPNLDWIANDAEGLMICDATSAVFAMDIDFTKLDVVTWSWQKALGGEGAHGMLALSPKAVKRLESYTPKWPLPKIFQLTKKGQLIDGIFTGATINTPSMLCVEDVLDALNWAESIGGLPAMIARSNQNFSIINEWVSNNDWIGFLAEQPATRSNTSVCLKITDPAYQQLDADAQSALIKKITSQLEADHIAYDIGAYRDAPAGFRVWCGATVQATDIKALTGWLDYMYHTHKPA